MYTDRKTNVSRPLILLDVQSVSLSHIHPLQWWSHKWSTRCTDCSPRTSSHRPASLCPPSAISQLLHLCGSIIFRWSHSSSNVAVNTRSQPLAAFCWWTKGVKLRLKSLYCLSFAASLKQEFNLCSNEP